MKTSMSPQFSPTQLDAANVYTDLKGLNSIKQLNKQGEDGKQQALQAVAKQFESVFLNMMMKSMREANDAFKNEEMSGSGDMEFYQQMFDQQLALSLSKNGVGIAEALVRQLDHQFNSGKVGSSMSAISMNSVNSRAHTIMQRLLESEEQANQVLQEIQTSQQPADTLKSGEASAEQLNSAARIPYKQAFMTEELDGTPENFREHLWPLAQKAAEKIGVDPRYLLSQAALETGWGKHMIRDEQGNNSFNLFGIKAKSDWQGSSANVATLEYRNGIALKERADFKAYNSYQESFDDYVKFVSQQPRYQQAVEAAADGAQYMRHLQKAGYATDPNYANKVETIVNTHFAEADRG